MAKLGPILTMEFYCETKSISYFVYDSLFLFKANFGLTGKCLFDL